MDDQRLTRALQTIDVPVTPRAAFVEDLHAQLEDELGWGGGHAVRNVRRRGPRIGLRCTECECVSEAGPGWVALIAEDAEGHDPPSVVSLCPPCASRVLEYEPRTRGYT